MEKHQTNTPNRIILLDRHMLSEGNLTGDNRNDPDIGGTELGRKQVIAEADFLMNELFPREGITEMPQIWAGGYKRVMEGLDLKLQRMHEINPDFVDFKQIIYSDDMLTERNFGDLAYVEHLLESVFKDDPIAQKSIMADLAKGKAVYEGVPHSARPAHGESHKDMGVYARLWGESVARDMRAGSNVHWVNGHGDVDKGIISKLFHWHDQDIWDRIPPIGNCDVIMIKGEDAGIEGKADWSIQKVYDGEKMKSCFEMPIYRTKPQRIGDFPFAQAPEL
ncbi:MAG: hypothetical protein COA45_05325 [Zetaproteobacteria bacterium]|nr:MAG: hypothetical protein COA45_05325 [Zetaproteobacteria bacterium]